MSNLLVSPCDSKAARYAVMNWHYSQAMPIGKLIFHGVWEDDKFKGAVIYGRGASPALGASFGLDQTQVCELVRVALTKHEHHVSEIMSKSIKLLKQSNPNMRLVVSFADPSEGHHGGIYQANGWTYTGESPKSVEVLFKGKWHHSRMLRPTGWGTMPEIARLPKEQQDKLPKRTKPGKFRYLFPLDRAMRRNVESLAKPYPRGSSLKGETADFQSARPGSIPGNRSKTSEPDQTTESSQ